jgi:hypothetical protein
MTRTSTITRKLTLVFHEDSAHGWLAVPHRPLQQLGVAHRISPYSYADADTAYLEEDEDQHIFLDAAEAASWHVEFESSYVDGFSPIRGLPRYRQSRR